MCLFLLLFQACYCVALSSSSSLPPFFCSCRLYTSLNPNYPHVSHPCQTAPFLTRSSSLLCRAHFCKRFSVKPHLLFFLFAEDCSLPTSTDLVKNKTLKLKNKHLSGLIWSWQRICTCYCSYFWGGQTGPVALLMRICAHESSVFKCTSGGSCGNWQDPWWAQRRKTVALPVFECYLSCFYLKKNRPEHLKNSAEGPSSQADLWVDLESSRSHCLLLVIPVLLCVLDGDENKASTLRWLEVIEVGHFHRGKVDMCLQVNHHVNLKSFLMQRSILDFSPLHL